MTYVGVKCLTRHCSVLRDTRTRRTLQCRVRHLTPTYVMTNELQLLNYAINNLHLA